MVLLKPCVMVPLAIQWANRHHERWSPFIYYRPLKNKVYG